MCRCDLLHTVTKRLAAGRRFKGSTEPCVGIIVWSGLSYANAVKLRNKNLLAAILAALSTDPLYEASKGVSGMLKVDSLSGRSGMKRAPPESRLSRLVDVPEPGLPAQDGARWLNAVPLSAL